MNISVYLFIILLSFLSCVNNSDGKKVPKSDQPAAPGDPALIWEKTFFGIQNDRPYEIKIGSNNRIYMLGQQQRQDSVSGETKVSVMLCLDLNGNKIWEKAFGNFDGTRMTSFDINDRNELIIVGYYYENKEAVFKALSRGWIVKCNADGETIEEKKIRRLVYKNKEEWR